MTHEQAFRFVCAVEELIYVTQRGITGPQRLDCIATLSRFVYRMSNGLPIEEPDIPPADGSGC
jgi:hypothetical protein